MKKTSKELEQQIINYYNLGNSMAATGKYYNISPVTVKNILERNNIPKRTKGGIYQLPAEEIIKRYNNGESCQIIASDYQVSFHTISNLLEENNIKRDNRYKNVNLDINYFHNINSIDKAYFLGFLLTDGNVGLNSNAVALALSSKDEEILKTFAKYTKNENQLYYRKDKPEVSLTTKCAQWKQDLAHYGVVPQKTYITDLPILNNKYMSHLIRGLFDGDGWISSKSHQVGFCGAEAMVSHVKEFLVNQLSIYDVKKFYIQKNIYGKLVGQVKKTLLLWEIIYIKINKIVI